MLLQHCILYKDVYLQNVSTIVHLVRLKYELPDDSHRPKHIGILSVTFK